MIKVEKIDIWGFEHAVRGCRNPLNSWAKSDTEVAFHALPNFPPDDEMAKKFEEWNDIYGLNVKIGPNDLDLMRRLCKAGPEHRKYLRQIFVSMDITAPLYWWKEADTYKVGTVANSCSTMHKIAAKEFTLDDFSHEHLTKGSLEVLNVTIETLNDTRYWYLNYDNMSEKDKEAFDPAITTKKDLWWQMIQLLPSSYNQKRTITMNYENVITMIKQRTGHKLDEWNEFCDILRGLPYIKEITED